MSYNIDCKQLAYKHKKIPQLDSRRKPSSWLPFWPKFFGEKFELEPLSRRPAGAPSAGAAISGCLRTQTEPSTRFQTNAKQLAFFLAQFFGKKFGQNWNRTSDTRIFSPLLYRLSYLAIDRRENNRKEQDFCKQTKTKTSFALGEGSCL